LHQILFCASLKHTYKCEQTFSANNTYTNTNKSLDSAVICHNEIEQLFGLLGGE